MTSPLLTIREQITNRLQDDERIRDIAQDRGVELTPRTELFGMTDDDIAEDYGVNSNRLGRVIAAVDADNDPQLRARLGDFVNTTAAIFHTEGGESPQIVDAVLLGTSGVPFLDAIAEWFNTQGVKAVVDYTLDDADPADVVAAEPGTKIMELELVGNLLTYYPADEDARPESEEYVLTFGEAV